MTRSRLPLSVILSVAIAASMLLFGSLVAAQACPLTDGSLTPGNLNRQSDASNNPGDVARLPDDSNGRSSIDSTDLAGIGAVAALFTLTLLYKVRRFRNVAPAEAELLNRYPQLEHPEMLLTLIPQEALPSTFDTEFGSAR